MCSTFYRKKIVFVQCLIRRSSIHKNKIIKRAAEVFCVKDFFNLGWKYFCFFYLILVRYICALKYLLIKSNIRVRFAPSPTGPLHIGGLRTALYNYLFAKKNNGVFILRIEDTDQSRYVNNAEEYITNALDWCNIPFDEGPGKNEKFGPYRQSERKELYKEYVNILIEKEKAYYAFDTPEELNAHRKQHEAVGKTFIYNWHNREKGRLKNSLVLTKEETKRKIEEGGNYVIRFKSPQNETLVLDDEIRGAITID